SSARRSARASASRFLATRSRPSSTAPDGFSLTIMGLSLLSTEGTEGEAHEIAEAGEVDAARLDEAVEHGLGDDDEREQPVQAIEARLGRVAGRSPAEEVGGLLEATAHALAEEALALVEDLGDHPPEVGLGLEVLLALAGLPDAANDAPAL